MTIPSGKRTLTSVYRYRRLSRSLSRSRMALVRSIPSRSTRSVLGDEKKG